MHAPRLLLKLLSCAELVTSIFELRDKVLAVAQDRMQANPMFMGPAFMNPGGGLPPAPSLEACCRSPFFSALPS